MIRRVPFALSLFLAGALHAQQLDIFDPDDFVDPRLVGHRAIFISRLVVGVAKGQQDQFRRVRDDTGYVHLANSLYWRGFQLDYKRSEVRGEHGLDDDPPEQVGGPVAHVTIPSGSGSAPPPVPGAKNVLQFSWYQAIGDRATLRYRGLAARQDAAKETVFPVPGLEGHDDTLMAQLDAGVFVRGRMRFATLSYAVLTRHSTVDETKQRTLTAGAFLPLVRVGPAILTPRVQVAGIRDAGPVIDLVNPALDLSLHVERAEVNLHVVYAPVVRFGGGSRVDHQLAIFADRALIVLPRRKR